MRRMATVTICVPLAACAARITSSDGYFPEPTISRDVNSRLPIRKMSCTLSTCHGPDDLDAIAVAHDLFRKRRAPHNPVVFGNRNAAFGRGDVRQQAFHRQAFRKVAHLAV